VKSRLDSYRGRLTPAQVAEGINAANANARRLVRDATVLLESKSYGSAASFAALAIEEAGKVSVLRGLALARSDEEAKQAWKDYRSHTVKNAAWILPQLVVKGARHLEQLRVIFDDSSSHPYDLDHVKQLGFYTDCLGKAHWSIPSDVIDGDLAASLIEIARLLASDREVSQKEIELWIEHVGPVWKGDLAWMKQAVVNWQRAMHSAGLSETTEEDMDRFVRGNES
jgi:AbiV family abortive infection protein